MTQSPLQGLKVLEYAHMVAGPLAGRRLRDLGAEVIKIEPKGGDRARRSLGVDANAIDGDHVRFHLLNGGKRSIELDFKVEADREVAQSLASEADVFIQNFRAGTLDRFGLGYEQLRAVTPRLVYASLTGFGTGAWRDDPGQDLLAQARSGLMWRNGARGAGPVAIGSFVTDIMAGALLAQGVLAALVRSRATGEGAHVETSLLEAALELQVDSFPMLFNSKSVLMDRSRSGLGGNPNSSAPYGVYATSDGHIAIVTLPQGMLAELLGEHAPATDAALGPEQMRDLVLESLAAVLKARPNAYWLERLVPRGGWVVEVLDWEQLAESEAFAGLGIMTNAPDGRGVRVMLSPVRIDGRRPPPAVAPRLNEHERDIRRNGWS